MVVKIPIWIVKSYDFVTTVALSNQGYARKSSLDLAIMLVSISKNSSSPSSFFCFISKWLQTLMPKNLNLHKYFRCDLRFSLSYLMQFCMHRYIYIYIYIFKFHEIWIILRLVLQLHDLWFYFPFLILRTILILTTLQKSDIFTSNFIVRLHILPSSYALTFVHLCTLV